MTADLTGTWWKSKRDGHRIRIVGPAAQGRWAAHHQRRDGWTHTYSVSVDTLNSIYIPVKPPRKR